MIKVFLLVGIESRRTFTPFSSFASGVFASMQRLLRAEPRLGQCDLKPDSRAGWRHPFLRDWACVSGLFRFASLIVVGIFLFLECWDEVLANS